MTPLKTLLIAGLTILTRILGLVRTLVFSQSIGASCLGTAYVTANQVPNLVYELVLGGALTSAMVPVLARSAERAAADPAERARVGQITSALLTWSVVILVPLLGWAGVSDFGAREIFPGYSLPAIWPEGAGYDELLLKLHAYFAFGLLALVALHVGIALQDYMNDERRRRGRAED